MAANLEEANRIIAEMGQRERKREVAEVLAKQALREAQAKAEANRAAVERAAKLAEQIESTRRYCWFSHRCNQHAETGNVEALTYNDVMASIPTDGSWPPGQSRETYYPSLASAHVAADDLVELPMIQAARKLGVKI